MIRRILSIFSGLLNQGTSLEIRSLEKGPEAIETYRDEAEAAPYLLKLIEETGVSCDGIMVNCFADPALRAIEETAPCAVIGPGKAAILMASLLGHSFSIISTGRANHNRFFRKS